MGRADSAPSTERIEKLLAELRERIRGELKDFSLPSDDDRPDVPNVSWMSVSAEVLPVPRLAQWVLTWGLGAPDYGKGEKRAWLVRFKYGERECALGLFKFGLRLSVHHESSKDDLKAIAGRILGRIDKAIRVAESELLDAYAEEQVRRGNLTIQNQYGLFETMYQHFRSQLEEPEEEARVATATSDDPVERVRDQIRSGLTSAIDAERDRFHASVAMVNAYFSMLEHLLVLLWPFMRYEPGRDDLEGLIKDRWSEKFKKVFDVVGDGDAKRIYDRLRGVAEQYRNTYAHGGFGKQRGTLFVHFPGGPPVPASLSGRRNQLRTSFFPVADPDIADITAVLDETDSWLRSGPAALGMKYVESGLNVAYDAGSIAQTRAMMTSNETFDLYLQGLSYSADAQANMDW